MRVPQNSSLPNFCGRFLLLLSFLLAFFALPAAARADSLEDAARALARRVAPALPPGRPVSLAWANRSSLLDAQADLLRRSFAIELESNKTVLAQDSSAPVLRVSLAEDPAEILFVAEVPSSAGIQVHIAAVRKAALPPMQKALSSPRLQKQLIWQQPEPILDAVEHTTEDGKPRLFLLLLRDSLALYRGEHDRWVLRDTKPLPPLDSPARDPRGKIWFSPETPDQARVVLPGKECDARLKDSIELNCRPAKDSWQDGMFLASSCDNAVWWLLADAGDYTVPDRLLLRKPSQGEPQPSVSELGVPGPVLSISSGQALRADTAVVFNLSTGSYEVYRITLACGD